MAYPDTRGLTRPEWLASLRPYLTPGTLKALAITDLDKVPDGHYAGYEILRQADETVTVRALYREGWAIDLYLTQMVQAGIILLAVLIDSIRTGRLEKLRRTVITSGRQEADADPARTPAPGAGEPVR